MDFNIYLFISKYAIHSFLHCFKIFDFDVYVYHMFYIVLFIMNIVCTQGSFVKQAFGSEKTTLF